MLRLIYTEPALTDLERMSDFLIENQTQTAADTLDLIMEAIAILARHPLIGRPVTESLRELIISRGKTGYMALYSIEPSTDTILVLAIRHQREVGCIP